MKESPMREWKGWGVFDGKFMRKWKGWSVFERSSIVIFRAKIKCEKWEDWDALEGKFK